jgi:hypothetical protein
MKILTALATRFSTLFTRAWSVLVPDFFYDTPRHKAYVTRFVPLQGSVFQTSLPVSLAPFFRCQFSGRGVSA